MSRERLATAYDNLAEAYAAVAHELRGIEPAAPPAVPGRVPSAPAATLPPRRTAPDTSGITECPAHNKAWVDGKFGPYCTGKSDDEVPDPNWFNDRGYCRVTPKSAGAWLKQHPNRPAPPPTQVEDIDDVPF